VESRKLPDLASIIIAGDTIAYEEADSLQNFVHRMNFKKTQGFGIVKKIESSELNLSH